MSILPKSKFSWILVLFIIYAYYEAYGPKYLTKKDTISSATSIEGQEGGNIPALTEEAPAEKQETLTDKAVNQIRKNETGKVILEALVRKGMEDKYGKKDIKIIMANKTGSLAIIDSVYGEGSILNCGAKAVINYEAYMDNGLKFDATKLNDQSSPVTIRTGGGQVIKGLEAGIVGMKVGGRRKISIPSQFAFDNPKFTNGLINKGAAVSYDVELVEVLDGSYKTSLTINTINETSSNGKMALCGDTIKAKYLFESVDQTAIPATSEEVEFTIGNGEVPIGLEFAAINMHEGGKKTVKIPNELLKSTEKIILPENIKFDENKNANVILELVKVN